MAEAQDKNFNLIYTLGVTAGIKRDGTTFDSREYSDGEWCRFQRGVPKKMGGYRQMFRMPDGIPRGMIANPYNGLNYMFIGYNNGMDVFTTGTTLGLGAGPYPATLNDFTADNRNLWQFDMQYSPSGDALKVLAHPGDNLVNIDNAVKTQVLIGDLLPSAGNTWTFNGLADTGGTTPTNLPIEVDGGVCVLYPFIFVYGSNGYIANNNVDLTDYANQTPDDWNGPLANQVNMAAGKVVKGMPIRGGTNSPSGLFWATDSLIRVSFTGQVDLYWRYDILSSQTSIMSSNSVVEMDGVFYWMGVDRFYLYNGSVSVLPNDKNVNWLFNNLNYEQRQKVWATKVPRYNEIWFFYPRGTATECTDAIIYNVKDKIWYDAGSAVGARRSCGYTTEVFPTPIWCGYDYEWLTSEPHAVIATPSGETAPTNDQFYLDGDQTPQYSPGSYCTFSNESGSTTYKITNSTFIFNANTLPNGATLVTVDTAINPIPQPGDNAYVVLSGYSVWQQEFGLNSVTDQGVFAIPSNFTTCDISWVGGDPGQDTLAGVNRRMHIARVEPDFIQNGDMTLNILGRPFARGDVETSGPYTFSPTTGKIDLRLEYREIKLQFASNTVDGNYELGRTLITATYGDERP